MGKPKKTGQVAKTAGNNTVKYEDPRDAFLSTKSDMVVKETEFTCDRFFVGNGATTETAVIAEDKNGFYITAKSFVNASVLDPYRQYRRDQVTVTKTETGFDIQSDIKGLMFSVEA